MKISSTTGLIIILNIAVFFVSVITASLYYVILNYHGFRIIYGATPEEVLLGRSILGGENRIPISWLQFYLSQINYMVVNKFFLWQMITSMFVHFGILHLTFNMLALFFFGYTIENGFGRRNFLIIYFISGFIGNLASLFLLRYLPYAGSAADISPSGGASGAIFGLLGALVILGRSSGSLFPALGYALVIFLFSSFIPGVNIFAHLFGLLGGMLASYLIARKKKGSELLTLENI